LDYFPNSFFMKTLVSGGILPPADRFPAENASLQALLSGGILPPAARFLEQ
jgi:hypothetical protein